MSEKYEPNRPVTRHELDLTIKAIGAVIRIALEKPTEFEDELWQYLGLLEQPDELSERREATARDNDVKAGVITLLTKGIDDRRLQIQKARQA